MSVINVLVIDLATAEGRAAYAEFSRPTVEPARIPEALLSCAAIADGAELASLRAMREALVKLRNLAVHADIAVAREIDEVLAVSASPPIESPAGLARAREALREAPSVGRASTEDPAHDALRERRLQRDLDRNRAMEPAMPPAPPSGTTELRDHRVRTIEALLTAIEREATETEHAGVGVGVIDQRIERLAHAVALLAGAPL